MTALDQLKASIQRDMQTAESTGFVPTPLANLYLLTQVLEALDALTDALSEYNPNHGHDGKFTTSDNAHWVVPKGGGPKQHGPAHPDYAKVQAEKAQKVWDDKAAAHEEANVLKGMSTYQRANYLAAKGNDAWLKKLSPTQKGAIKTYTGHAYRQINEQVAEALRNGTPLTKEMKSTITKAKNGLLKNATPADMTVIRGVKSSMAHQFVQGQTWSDKAFFSTTIKPGEPDFGNFKLTVMLPKGTPGAYVNSFSNYPNEHEFLMPPGANFHVVSTSPYGATLYYLGQTSNASGK